MNKKEYIEKMSGLILNRLRFHAPIMVDGDVDFKLLELVGIDGSIPIFKFEKKLSSIMLDCFLAAQKQQEFNLVVNDIGRLSKRKIKAFKHFICINEEAFVPGLLQLIDKLNINYKSQTSFYPQIEKDFVKANDVCLQFDYREYYLYNKIQNNGVVFETRQFLLNGRNYILTASNTREEDNYANFEINIVLPRGYYVFSKERDAIRVENLTSREVGYFNFHFPFAKFNFSLIDGLTSSTHACINVKLNIRLTAKSQKRFYFNYGENKYCLISPKQQENFFDMSQDLMNKIFAVKVISRDKHFQQMFNRYMPRKIWENWLNFSQNDNLELNYLKALDFVAKKTANGWEINEKNKNLKQVSFYQNSGYKRVFIVPGPQRYLYAGKDKYYDFKSITNDIFRKSSEIYLSFGG